MCMCVCVCVRVSQSERTVSRCLKDLDLTKQLSNTVKNLEVRARRKSSGGGGGGGGRGGGVPLLRWAWRARPSPGGRSQSCWG